jgi:predicted ArsR family transcriptional regulator
MIKNTKRFQFRRGETKELIINVLKRGKKLTTSEIARQLKISHWCAWDHLNDLRKEGKVILEKRKFFNIWSLNSKNN